LKYAFSRQAISVVVAQAKASLHTSTIEKKLVPVVITVISFRDIIKQHVQFVVDNKAQTICNAMFSAGLTGRAAE